MSDQQQHEQKPDVAEDGIQDNRAAESASSQSSANPAATADSSVIDEEVLNPQQAAEAELNHWRNVALRTAADFDNFRKRVAREREEAVRFGNQDLLEQLLPVLDNFEMGMQAAAADQQSMIYIGMDMVRKQLHDFLAQNGVTEVQALGQPFDPNLHEAVSEEESVDVAEGVVLRVLRRGFRLRERLMRPATVVVAKAKGGEA